MVREYLNETLPAIFKDAHARSMIDRAFSSPDTFFYIRRYARIENLEGIPQV